ncbi:MAG: hypothetical protein HOH24_06810 [Chromatiales bacterium]|jgi:hypothetical protein|nr:hypothetical protein [Chromatiales bacterium]
MEFWVGFFVVVVILGALAGGESFGSTISKGVGCLFLIAIVGFIFLMVSSGS